MKTFNCPICGFNNLRHDPQKDELYSSYDICKCCGIEFGYEIMKPDDVERIDKLRADWLASGAPFFNSQTEQLIGR